MKPPAITLAVKYGGTMIRTRAFMDTVLRMFAVLIPTVLPTICNKKQAT